MKKSQNRKMRTFQCTKSAEINRFQRIFGPSDRVRTCGLMVPNHPRYQLRYTRIFTFSVSGNFTVCGQSCGQMQFWGTFRWAVKSRNLPCSKGFRRFGFPRLGYRHGTPKPPALPTALHPVMPDDYTTNAAPVQLIS